MSGPLINRSLTTIRTELEFLKDSEVIDDDLYQKLLGSLPAKYEKGMNAWGVDHIQAGAPSNSSAVNKDATENLSNELKAATLNSDEATKKPAPAAAVVPPPNPPTRSKVPSPLGYCKVLYDYNAQQPEDLSVRREDQIAVVEHLSEDWWKGYKKSEDVGQAGVFPSNYVQVISEQEFNSGPSGEKATYQPSPDSQPPPQYYDQGNTQFQSNTPQQPLGTYQQPSYGGYAQYPPPSVNYSPHPMQAQPIQAQPVQVAPGQPVEAQQSQSHPNMRRFGSKLGNAAIFGAGATIGSDLVNSIF